MAALRPIKHTAGIFFFASWLLAGYTQAQTTNLTGPTGSGAFGTSVTILTNGNYVVTDPLYDENGITDIGAVYLYHGATHVLISMLKGSTANDKIGNGGVTALSNGNYVIRSSEWDNGATTDAGAVTWGSGTTGVSGVVNSSNSLVGSTTNDKVGSSLFDGNSVIALNNGNYVVISLNWDNGTVSNAGAVTWCDGTSGRTGTISSSNSLVGSTANDQVGGCGGNPGFLALKNENFVIISNYWDNGTATDAGAVTWCDGTSGRTGTISSSNSLVGSKKDDQIGSFSNFMRVTALRNGNYLVRSTVWDNGAAIDAGAVTWGDGTTGISGVVSSANSLVGSKTGDSVGASAGSGIIELSNGNYVVTSQVWDNGTATDAGAATWGSGTTGVRGVVSSSNSLVGSTKDDNIGQDGVVVLSNGNYVVLISKWDNGAIADVGAVTWGSGTTGVSGVVSSSNSLIGTKANDKIGGVFAGVIALSNGNYVVRSPNWDNGAVADAGAATWGNGTTGVSGIVSSSNSLVGSKTNDRVGSDGITVLKNGNYVVHSPYWDNGVATDAGAVTWGDGTTGVSGEVNSSNSLVGGSANNFVGDWGVTALENGNYVVISSSWGNGVANNVGAATWGSGTTGVSGVVSSSNSLVGSKANDRVGGASNNGVIALSNGNYVVRSPNWDNGAATNAGAVTWGDGTTGVSGEVSSSNSLVGSTTGDQIGGRAIALRNGNYVVISQNWDNGTATDVGAVTWGSGTTGVSGVVNSSNSLVGSTANDQVGTYIHLINANYVVSSPDWDNGAIADVGAVTWGDGTTGVNGVVSSSNSLVGSTTNDQIGTGYSLSSFPTLGSFWVRSFNWDNGTTINAGAITLGSSIAAVNGVVNACNSVVGTIASARPFFTGENTTYNYSIVSIPNENRVAIFIGSALPSLSTHLDNRTENIVGTGITAFVNNECRIIATVEATGASPIGGSTTAKAWVEATQPTGHVKRHYEILPTANAITATGKVTLYFTQAEFDAYNAVNVTDLPANSSDEAGKAALKIKKYDGTSSDGTGAENTYTGTPTVIDPDDNDIVWNAALSRWEVSFGTTGFGGFFIYGCTTPTIATPASSNSPICTGTALNLSVTASGTAPLTYAWSGTGTYTNANTATPTVTGAATGTYTVTVTNGCGSVTNTAAVVVTPATPPTITCPPNTTVAATGPCQGTVGTYSPATLSDNCTATPSVVQSPAPNTTFTGSQIVTLTATNDSGNTATCTFTVATPNNPAFIICPPPVVRNSDANTCGTVVAYPNATASDNCGTLPVTQTSGPLASGSTFPVGVHVVVFQATNSASTTTCSVTVTVVDGQAPTLTCPGNRSISTVAGTCAAPNTYAPAALSDNCTANPALAYSFSGVTTAPWTTGTGSGSSFNKGTTTVTLRATDGAGLTKTCTFRVIVNDTEAPILLNCVSPAPVNAAATACSATVTYTMPTFTDNCAPTNGTAVRLSGPVSGGTVAVGSSNVVFQAADASGRTSRCTITLTVLDNQLPTINCPPSVTVSGSGTPCASIVFYDGPTASDNCDGPLAPFLASGLGSGTTFPAGTTVNTWRAVASNGQSSECTVSVTVNCGANRPNTAEDRAKDAAPNGVRRYVLSPNPATELVHVAWEGPAPDHVSVFDAQGRLVWEQGPPTAGQSITFDVSGWAAGIYVVALRTGDTLVTKRLSVLPPPDRRF